jgi:hypothetical protein
MKILRVLWGVLVTLAVLAIFGSVVVLSWLFASGGMAKVTAWYLFQLVPPVLGLVTLILVIVRIAVRKRVTFPAGIVGGIAILAMLPALLMVFPVTYPASLATMTPAATIRLPANIPLKVGWGGDDVKVNAHAFVPDQRWAYDLLAEPFGKGEKLEDYGIYGVPVVAPAAGEIVAAHDGEPDRKPGVVSNDYKTPLGNYVVIRLPTKTFLIIAHLKPGSVLVKAGDHVEEGQAIAACGNSGNTSEPHIHIHHQRQDPRAYPVNFAEGLPLYFRDHDGPAMPAGGYKMENGEVVFLGPTVRHVGK